MHTTTVYLTASSRASRAAHAPATPATTSAPPATPTPPTAYASTSPGTGSPLVKAAHDRGLSPEIVASWPGSNQTERAMKRRHRLAHCCPRCGT